MVIETMTEQQIKILVEAISSRQRKARRLLRSRSYQQKSFETVLRNIGKLQVLWDKMRMCECNKQITHIQIIRNTWTPTHKKENKNG